MLKQSLKEKIYKGEVESDKEVVFKLVGYLKVYTGSFSRNVGCSVWRAGDMGHCGPPEEVNQFTSITTL